MRIGIFVAVCFFLSTIPISASAQDWCYNADSVYAVVIGSTIIVHHDAAFYNCCPDEFVYAITLNGSTIGIDENEILTDPCYCLCCYNLSTLIENAAPGEHQIVFRWYDYENNGWMERELVVTVPDCGQTGPTALGEAFWDGCITETSVPVPVPQDWTWGGIKTLFR